MPDFFLVNPVNRGFAINDRFNVPRNYSFAPGKKQLHEGIDLRSVDSQGNPVAVFAGQRGTVDKVGFAANGYGNYVRIRHEWEGETYVTWYGHLSATSVKAGDFVLAGQKIGIAGTTGFSTGIHLHLTLQHIGKGLQGYVVSDVVDPEPFFRLDAVPNFDEATFVSDVNFPDGTKVEPGQVFRKTWRVRNSGTSTWDSNCRLVFVGGEPMGAPNELPLVGGSTAPGQTRDLTVRLTAPNKAGTHRTTWILCNSSGHNFQHELYAEIVIERTEPFDHAAFVADVTVEDGTKMEPGQKFTKTWRVRNDGTKNWSTNYALRHVGGQRMNGPDKVPLPREVKQGNVVEISVELTAPNEPGRHRSIWILHNDQDKAFDSDVYAEIQVPGRQAVVATGQKLSEMSWLADVTVPDNSRMQPGETFEKVWRVRNSGESSWGDGFELVFAGDNQMGGLDAVPLPHADPGEVVEVSVKLTAPNEAGTHRSTWKGRDPQGKIFEFDLFAIIEVEEVAREFGTAATHNEILFVADVSVPDGMGIAPGEKFVKTWRVRNTGNTTWGAGYSLGFFGDDRMDGPESVALPAARPGDTVEISIELTAPQTGGLHKSAWKGRDPQGKTFEYDLFALIDVVDPKSTVDMLKYLRGDGRVYDLRFDWAGGGSQRVQTQREGRNRFYHVKFQEWEELWHDDRFIYRGTDTSPGNNQVYTLFENGQYGSPWLPRFITVGVPFRRMPTVIFRNKQNGQEVRQGQHTTWITLDAIHKEFTFPTGLTLKNVVELSATEVQGGEPFERYFYAVKHGLVGWRGHIGQSNVEFVFDAGTAPDLQREPLPWLKRE